MNVLVVGGAGYIGSHVAKALAKASFSPVTYDNLLCGHKSAVCYGPLEIGDIHNSKRLSEVLIKYDPIAVFHFAALTAIGESVQNPAKYYHNNLIGTFNLLEAIRAYKTIPFLFSSTCAIYGLPHYIPIDENHPQLPINPYGRSKLMVEKIIQDYHRAYNLPICILRYFNAAGADLDEEIGEDHEPENHLIPLILNTVLGKQPSINIFGTDYETPDGTAIRDYIHVQDLAEAHVRSLKYLLTGNTQLELNLGTGTGYSVKQVIDQVENICNQTVNKNFCKRREGDAPILIADSAKCRSLLNWTPSCSDLPTIIGSAWQWHKKMQKKMQESEKHFILSMQESHKG
ncbi:MAG: UDP-glucose 4-epimerase GalE [Chlamydiales bacterium]|nr:UDP-glucose 4-epimerase GalE [Chlamydiales bacterium]